MFSKGDEEKFSTSVGQEVAPMTYGILTVVTLVFLVASMFGGTEILIPKIVVLVFLLAISLYSGTFGRRKGCPNCKMRLACPGSAVKEGEESN